MQPFHVQLEQDFTAMADRQHVVACSSGTSSLHLALETLREQYKWEDGDEVIIPDYTMLACPRSVSLAGLTPVFVDCTNELVMDVELLNQAVTLKTRAIMAVHIYGRRCQMNVITNWAKSRGIQVIEDLAEAHGVFPHESTDAACWSFYKNKIVAGEEGGAVAFIEAGQAKVAKSLRTLGGSPENNYYHRPRGHNYRLADCLAEKILQSLYNFGPNKDKRELLWKVYDAQSFSERQTGRLEPQAKWVYDLWIKGMDWLEQDRVIERLLKEGIAARHGFKPMHMQAEYKKCRKVVNPKAKGPNSVTMSKETIYLSLTPGHVTKEQIELSARLVKEVLKN